MGSRGTAERPTRRRIPAVSPCNHRAGRSGLRQPELAARRRARPDAARGFCLPREYFPTSTTSASPNASSTRGSGAHGFFESPTTSPDLTMAAPSRRRATHAAFVRFDRRSATRAPPTSRVTSAAPRSSSIRGRQLGHRRQQHPGLLHQDATKFPDLVHAAKDEPDRGFPQAASAHDNFWQTRVAHAPDGLHDHVHDVHRATIPRRLSLHGRLRLDLPAVTATGTSRSAQSPKPSSGCSRLPGTRP